jgi:hypothetical protein
MKKIILDHFRRWRFALISIGIVYFLFQGFFVREGISEMSDTKVVALLHQTVFTIFIFQIIMFLAFFLIYDFQRGFARVLTTLPMTTKQIGRALWFASVGLPALALTVIGLLALFIFSIGTNKTISLENYLIGCIFAAPTLGAFFGALTFTTTWIIPVTFADRIRVFFSNAIFMLPFLGFFFLQGKNPTMTEAILFFLALTILSIIGWFRAEKLVLNRTGFRPISRLRGKQAWQYKTPIGFGGIPFLITKTTSHAFLMYLFLVAFMLAMPIFFEGHHTLQESIKINASGYNLVIFSAWAVGLFQIFPMFIQLRLLRTLPISTTQLAAVLVFLPIISLALLGIVIGLFFFPFVGQMEALKAVAAFLIPMTMVSIGIPLVAWLGLERNTLALIGLGFFIGIAVVPLWFSMDKIPLSTRYTAVALLTLVSFFGTKSSLAHGSKTYRINLANLGAWGGRRWY